MGFLQIIEGAAAIAAGVAVDVFSGGSAAWVGNLLISAGAGQVISGVGSMISGSPIKGFATTLRNSIAPWRICYGRCRTGGTLVYMHQWGENNQMLDLVIVLCANRSQAVDELLFDQQRIQIDTGAVPTSARAGYSIASPAAGSGTSFTPVQQEVTCTKITRSKGVVEVELPQDIPYLDEGDQIIMKNVPGDDTLNGTFQVADIIDAPATHTGGAVGLGGPGLKFTFLSGGQDAVVLAAGHCRTKWADYGRNVYFEPLLGDQELGQTFVGMTAGTPWQGTGKLCTPASPQNAGGDAAPNPWTQYCSLQGKTAVFLRLKYDSKYFPAGLPQISFHLRGKCDVYDPRQDQRGYTENAALCIADFLADKTWGFKAEYGAEIPLAPLIAAADDCDGAVALARGGTEPRYACNGQFELNVRRGEVLQNLLTSCAGRLTYVGGQFEIHPGVWKGSGSPPAQVNLTALATAPYRWRPAVPIRDLFNGAKGTYISPANKWQSTDFPAYAQDANHGYHGPEDQGGDILLAADHGERRWLELHLPFTISSSAAQRIAKIELLRRRGRAGTMVDGAPSAGYGGTGTFPLSLAGYQFAPLDVFEATVPFLAFANKLLEVESVRFDVQDTEGGQAKRLGVEIDVQETDSSIYAWSAEEELSPQAYVQTALPQGTFSEQVPFPWSPGEAAPPVGDAIGGAASFGIRPVYGTDAQGNGTAALQITGVPPINALDTGVSSPAIACAASDSGGALPPGTYVVGLAAFNSGAASQALTNYLDLAVVEVGGTGSGSIQVTITWGSGDVGGELYMGRWRADGFLMHQQGSAIAPGTEVRTIESFDETTHGGPDDLFDHFGVIWQREQHGGIFALQVAAVTATTITFGSLVAGDVAVDAFAGRILSLLAKADLSADVPLLNLPVASNTASSGMPAQFTVTIGPNGSGHQAPDLTTLLAVGDLLVMRFLATFSADGFADPLIANGFYPDGADPAQEVGRVAIVLSGADAGDVQMIRTVEIDGAGHYTDFRLQGRWKVTPAAGDLVVVCDAAVQETPSSAFLTRNGSTPARFAVRLDNLPATTWLCRVRTEDAASVSGPDSLAPCRELYFWGSQGTRTITEDAEMRQTDGRVYADATAGPITYTALPVAETPEQPFVIEKIDDSANTVTMALAEGDSFRDGSSMVVLSVKGDTFSWKAGE